MNVTHSSVSTWLCQLKMKPRNKFSDFCERVDSVFRIHENCKGPLPLTEHEKMSAFYQKLSGFIIESRSADLIRRQIESREIYREETKSFLSQ